MWLKTEDYHPINQGKLPSGVVDRIKVGAELDIGVYSMEIVELCAAQQEIENIETVSESLRSEVSTCTTNMKRPQPSHPLQEEDRSMVSKRSRSIIIDPSLLAVLKPHQLEAVSFLLDRLTSPACNMTPDDPPTGAILADDVGTGETLVGLAVLHTLTRHYSC
jgi:SNF2 family DNA or RNA helicase